MWSKKYCEMTNRDPTGGPAGSQPEKVSFEFDGQRYRQSSTHQKEWGMRPISELALRGDEAILDVGCGDAVLTARLARLVPRGRVLGIDASTGMGANA